MQKTVRKVLAELQSDKPDLSYIRGLLEGLVDEEVVVVTPKTYDDHGAHGVKLKDVMNSDEQEEIPAFAKPGPLGKLSS